MPSWTLEDGSSGYFAIARGDVLRIDFAAYDPREAMMSESRPSIEQSIASFVAEGPALDLRALVPTAFLATISNELGDKSGWLTPAPDAVELLAAAAAGDAERARTALAAGASVETSDRSGMTALGIACRARSASVVELLLAGGANPDRWFGADRHTALHGLPAPELVTLLLAHGASIDAHRGDGATPLMCAASAALISEVDRLLDAGADLEARDKDDRTVLLRCIAGCYERRAEMSALCEHLIDRGAALDVLDRWKNPPLYQAVEAKNARLVRRLLRAGASATFGGEHSGLERARFKVSYEQRQHGSADEAAAIHALFDEHLAEPPPTAPVHDQPGPPSTAATPVHLADPPPTPVHDQPEPAPAHARPVDQPRPSPHTTPEPPRAPPAAATPSGMGRAIAFTIGAAAIVGIALLALYFNCVRVTVSVTQHGWRRTIAIEELGTHSETALRADIPEGAAIGECKSEVSGWKQVRDGTECHSEGGRYTRRTKCVDKYKSEPESYADRCTYELLGWHQVDALVGEGADLAPRWPETHLPASTGEAPPAGSRREGKRTEELWLELRGGEIRRRCPVTEAVWRRYADGDRAAMSRTNTTISCAGL